MTSDQDLKLRGKHPGPDEVRAAVTGILAAVAATRELDQANEATTRVGLVDKLLDAMGWPFGEIKREQPSGTGLFLDYELRVRGEPWMVVEAKRTERTFRLARPTASGRATPLRSLQSLLTSGGQPLREVLNQAAGYCNDRGIPLAAVTNGTQWVFFRGLSARHRQWMDGVAIAFDRADLVEASGEFFGCLSRSCAGTPYLPDLLDRVTHVDPPAAHVPRDHIELRRPTIDPHTAAVLGSVCDYLLADIYGSNRQAMLKQCYIEPGVKGEFERSIERLLRDTANPITLLDSQRDDGPKRAADDRKGEESNLLDGDSRDFVEHVTLLDRTTEIQNPVVVVGHVGAGKTTFLHRSLSHFEPNKGAKGNNEAFYALVDLEGHGEGGAVEANQEEQKVAEDILRGLKYSAQEAVRSRKAGRSDAGETNLERLLERTDPYSLATLQSLFGGRLKNDRKLGEKVWAKDPGAWDRKEYEILSEAKKDAVDLLVRFVKHLREHFHRADKRRYPVLIVLDNLDQATDDYQRCIYGLARQLARRTHAIIVVCLREDTYNSGLGPNGFLASSNLQFVFHVKAPPLDHVVRQRAKFGKQAVESGKLPTALAVESDALIGVCDLLGDVFLTPKSEAIELASSVSGHNIREALGIVRSVVAGRPSIAGEAKSSAAFALDCILATRSQESVRNLLGPGNCLDADPWNPPCHALRVRMLAYLSWSFESNNDRVLHEMTDLILARFSSWGYPLGLVKMAVASLLAARLIRPRTKADFSPLRAPYTLPQGLSLTASGRVHLTRLVNLPVYRAATALRVRWYDKEFFTEFVRAAQAAGGDEGPSVADIAASKALDIFDSYLAVAVGREDGYLGLSAAKPQWLSEVISRSAQVLPSTDLLQAKATIVPPPRPSRRAKSKDVDKQLPLFEETGQPPSSLGKLLADASFGGDPWVVRVLWALEWGRERGTPAMLESDIWRTLNEHTSLRFEQADLERALRSLNRNTTDSLWSLSKKRYQITPAGSLLVTALARPE